MNDSTSTAPPPTLTSTEDQSPIELGDAVLLTEGQGRGSSEDKRRAYNA